MYNHGSLKFKSIGIFKTLKFQTLDVTSASKTKGDEMFNNKSMDKCLLQMLMLGLCHTKPFRASNYNIHHAIATRR